jgi:hypothetical protein
MEKHTTLIKLLLLSGPLLLASCGGPKKPSTDQLKEWFSTKGGNAAIEIGDLQTQYSPMKELMGTTLPEGSWMIQAKINGKLKEALYQNLNDLSGSDPDAVKSKAFWDEVNEVEKDVDILQTQAKKAGVLLPQMPIRFITPGSIKEIHPPGAPIELNFKLLATQIFRIGTIRSLKVTLPDSFRSSGDNLRKCSIISRCLDHPNIKRQSSHGKMP